MPPLLLLLGGGRNGGGVNSHGGVQPPLWLRAWQEKMLVFSPWIGSSAKFLLVIKLLHKQKFKTERESKRSSCRQVKLIVSPFAQDIAQPISKLLYMELKILGVAQGRSVLSIFIFYLCITRFKPMQGCCHSPFYIAIVGRKT